MPRITPFLWFDTEAEAAAELYVSIFENSRITGVTRYGDAGPGPKGQAMTVGFELEGQPYTALNGGPVYKLNEAFSLVVHCRTQTEVDYYWDRLTSDGGSPSMCGWLKDRFGLSWQITPDRLVELLTDPDAGEAQRVMAAMLTMQKIDIAKLEQAYAG